MDAANDASRRSKYLVETDWLEQHLNDPDLRVFDCTVLATMNPASDAKFPFSFTSGSQNFNSGHIPGAGFLDLLDELSDGSSELPFVMPPQQQLANAFAKSGIGEATRVILYSTAEPIWAARIWWMLRSLGFDNAAILNGGWAKWIAEEKPISTGTCKYFPEHFSSQFSPECFIAKEDILAAIGNSDIRTINALPPMIFSGLGGPVFGRKGRISGSVNVPFTTLHDPDSGTYLPIDQLRKIFDTVAVDQAKQIITYCGSGIAASNDAFVLALLGYDNVVVYDKSMAEWGYEDTLPMEIG